MKKKFNFWLNIVTICFCVCAIAVGVYSATTASITASGKIGFVAHGCNADITGTIYGHGATLSGTTYTDSADGNPVPSSAPVALNNGNTVQVRGNAQTLPLGTRYFSDMESNDGKPADIVITLEVKNVSNFKITATMAEANITGTSAIVASCAPTSADIDANATATFTITISLNATNGTYAEVKPTADNFSMTMSFDRWVEPELHTVKITTSESLMGEFERFYCLIDDSVTEVPLELGENVVYVESKIKLGYVLDMSAPGYMDITSTPNVYTKTKMMINNAESFLTEEIEISVDVEFIFKLYITA